MRRAAGFACILVASVALVSLSLRAHEQDERKTEDPERWQDKMQALAEVLGELLPELAARKGDNEVIEKNARKLADLTHALTKGRGERGFLPPPDADPSLALLAGRLDLEARRAYQAFHDGDVEYGKLLLRTATTYCISCHTRDDQGPGFRDFPLNPRAASLSRSERAELLAATLQFDKALAEFQAIVTDGATAGEHPLAWERAIHHALAIAVRVKNDPDLARDVVTGVLARPDAAEFMKQNAARWQESISRWKAESKRKARTEKSLFVEMKRLLNEARQLQEYPADRGAEILYLRTSAAAHELLRIAPDGVHAAEAIFTAGMAYDALNDPPLWPIHELYYEACIRKAPHTGMAEECYRRYEEAIYLGYSGSGGTFIPDDVMATLVRLKQLARIGRHTK